MLLDHNMINLLCNLASVANKRFFKPVIQREHSGHDPGNVTHSNSGLSPMVFEAVLVLPVFMAGFALDLVSALGMLARLCTQCKHKLADTWEFAHLIPQ